MIEETLPSNVPAYLQKDLVSTRHEVPVANGGSRAVFENYYTPRLLGWAFTRWLHDVPKGGNPHALERALRVVCADSRTFHAYLQVPDAFAELVSEEAAKEDAHRSDCDSLKRVFDERAGSGPRSKFFLGSAAFAVIAFAIVALAR
jgi:hypothetical protein